MLYRLNPVTPALPKNANNQPPTIAPITPRTMSRKKPSPALFTILLAMNPAISPRMIQPIIDISNPRVVLRNFCQHFADFRVAAGSSAILAAVTTANRGLLGYHLARRSGQLG